MVIAIVVLSIVCAELAVALAYSIYKYRQLDNATTQEVMDVIQQIREDEEEREFEVSFPNSEGF